MPAADRLQTTALPAQRHHEETRHVNARPRKHTANSDNSSTCTSRAVSARAARSSRSKRARNNSAKEMRSALTENNSARARRNTPPDFLSAIAVAGQRRPVSKPRRNPIPAAMVTACQGFSCTRSSADLAPHGCAGKILFQLSKLETRLAQSIPARAGRIDRPPLCPAVAGKSSASCTTRLKSATRRSLASSTPSAIALLRLLTPAMIILRRSAKRKRDTTTHCFLPCHCPTPARTEFRWPPG